MNVKKTIVTGLLLVLFCSPSTLAGDEPPKKVALLVGVNKYLKPGFADLRFAEADVQAVARELEGLGFETTVLLGSGKGNLKATQSNIEKAAWTMVRPLGKDDIAIVMLSGHGQQLSDNPNDRNFNNTKSYYCPVDAIINRPETQSSLSHLLDEILAPNVGRKMLIIDACRDVPVDPSRGARTTKGIEGRRVDLPEDTAVFFSCRAGQQSFERAELGHGLFTYCLLDGLRGNAARAGELSWSDLVSHVNRRMAQPDIIKHLPRSRRQTPIPAGALPYTVLARIDQPAAPRVTKSHSKEPSIPSRSRPGQNSQVTPAVKDATPFAQRKANLMLLSIAMHAYCDVNKHFPAAGPKSGLSWRVHLLPFLDERALYDRFRLNEPWDSPHNKPLIQRMPAVFGSQRDGKTSFHVFVGPGTPFSDRSGPTFSQLTDGISNILMIVEAGSDKAEPWTKPSNLTLDRNAPLKSLGNIGASFLISRFDASVRSLPSNLDATVFSQLVDPSDGASFTLPEE